MQKKLIAVVVALAMLLSTFGVVAPVFAVPVVYEVNADKDYILTATTNTVRVTVLKDGKANRDSLNYAVWESDEDGKRVANGTFSSGSFNVVINAADYHNEEYYIVIYDGEEELGVTSVITKHDMSLTIPSIKIGDTKTISGTVKDGAGDKLEERPYVYIVKDGDDIDDAIASTRASSNGSFALAAKFEKAGDYVVMLTEGDEGMPYNTIEYGEFEVAAKDTLSVSVNKSSVMKGRTEEIEVKVKDGSKLKKEAAVEISLGNDKFYGTTDGDGKAFIEVEFAKTGTAKVKAKWDEEYPCGNETDAKAAFGEEAPGFDYKGETTLKVTAPSTFNLFVDTDEVDAVEQFDLEVTFKDGGSEGKGIVDKEGGKGRTYGGLKKVKINVDGCGLDKSKTLDIDTESAIEEDELIIGWEFEDLRAKYGGDITVKAVATFHDGTVITKTETVKVKGWKITVAPADATYDKEYEFKVVVTKPDGTPVNNAIVWLQDDNYAFDGTHFDADEWDTDDKDWVEFEEIDSRDTNINNGTYAKKIRFNTVGKAIVLVTNADGDNKAYAKIEVLGEDVYTLSAPEKLVAGLKEDVEFKVKDEDGKAVKEAVSKVEVTFDGDKYDVELDGDVYSFSYVTDETGEYELIFKTQGGEFIGKATIEVVAPKLELTHDDNKLTYGVKEVWTAKLLDPRDDSLIEDAELQISAVACSVKVWVNDNLLVNDDEEEVIVEDCDPLIVDLGDGEATFKIFAFEDEDADEDAAKKVVFKVSIDGEDKAEVATIDVVPLGITASPAKIGVDTVSTVTIAVVDAHGKAYAGKDIKLSGPLTAESETDADGKVSFKVKPTSTGKITIAVKTDDKDNDAEGKIDVVLEAVGAATISMQLGNLTAVANGGMSTLGVAPYAENGRTMVPFRYIGEALGAYVEYVAPDKVIYRLRVDADTVNVVELTIGSTVAYVNGVEYTLEVAPKIVNGYTVVPLRFVGEALGFYVDYNFGTQVITLTK